MMKVSIVLVFSFNLVGSIEPPSELMPPLCPINTVHNPIFYYKNCYGRIECIRNSNTTHCFQETITIHVENVDAIRKGNFKIRSTILKFDSIGLKEIEAGRIINLTKLLLLDASWHQIEKVNFGIFNGVSVEKVYLRKNQISVIVPDAFQNLAYLSLLDLQENKLRTFNQIWFGENSKLESLCLNSNLIKFLEPYAFSKLQNLKDLKMSTNFITQIEKYTFRGLQSINFIDLSHNHLKTIEYNAFQNSTKIHLLDLSFNFLRYLPKDMVNCIKTIENLYLLPNPWICECLDEIYYQLGDMDEPIVEHEHANLWNNSYPACIVPLIKKDYCNEDFVYHLENDKILKKFFKVSNYGYFRIRVD